MAGSHNRPTLGETVLVRVPRSVADHAAESRRAVDDKFRPGSIWSPENQALYRARDEAHRKLGEAAIIEGLVTSASDEVLVDDIVNAVIGLVEVAVRLRGRRAVIESDGSEHPARSAILNRFGELRARVAELEKQIVSKED